MLYKYNRKTSFRLGMKKFLHNKLYRHMFVYTDGSYMYCYHSVVKKSFWDQEYLQKDYFNHDLLKSNHIKYFFN